MNPEKRRGRPRDEYPNLVDGIIGRVEGSVMFEWGVIKWKEKCRSYPLIDGVFCA